MLDWAGSTLRAVWEYFQLSSQYESGLEESRPSSQFALYGIAVAYNESEELRRGTEI